MHDVGDGMLTATRSTQFEHRSIDGDVGGVRRPFFDWLERRSPQPVVREELLQLVTCVLEELTTPSPVGVLVTADDGGDNVLVQFLALEYDDELSPRLGRAVAAAEHRAIDLSVEVIPMSGNGYVLLDVLLPH